MEKYDAIYLLIELCKTTEGRIQIRENGNLRALCCEMNQLRSHRQCYLLGIRALRNACAGSLANVQVLEECAILTEVYEYLTYIRDYEPLPDDLDFHDYKRDVVIASCQLFANFCNCGEIGARSFWTRIGTEGLTHLFAFGVSVKSPRAVAATLAVVHACLLHDTDGQHSRRIQLLECRHLCAQLVLAVMDVEVAQNLSSSDKSPAHSGGQSDKRGSPSAEWFHLLVLHLARTDSVAQLLALLAPRNDRSVSYADNEKVCRLTHEQVIVLHVLEGTLADPLFLRDLTSRACDQEAEVDPSALQPPAVRSVLATTSYICECLCPPSFGPFVDTDDVLSFCRPVNALPAVLASFTFLSAALAALSGSTDGELLTAVKSRVVCSGVVHLCVVFLGQCKARVLGTGKEPPGGVTGQPNDVSDNTGGLTVEYARELVKAALSLLMNVCHRFTAAQDLVRDLDGLPVVLSFCATDFDNPLCREYALMCVRNLCEGNAGNQQYISDLKPQQIVQDELMASHGLSVEIDPLSGRFQFKRKSDFCQNPTEGLPPQDVAADSKSEGCRENDEA